MYTPNTKFHSWCFRKKKREYVNDTVTEIETNSKINIMHLYKAINKFKNTNQSKVPYESFKMVTITDKWKDFLQWVNLEILKLKLLNH